MSRPSFVPTEFVAPRELRAQRFRLEPLSPQHNEADLAAWMSSIEHIQGTPGFANHGWPPDDGFSAADNLRDLERHADEFERRVAFAFTVLPPDSVDASVVLGCLYLDPGPRPGAVDVRSWVRADVADLDAPLRHTVREWLARSWPFDEIIYAG